MIIYNDKNEKPLVSIVIPLHNAQKTLGKTLLSLIDQNFPKNQYEIILVDDGSTDDNIEEIKKISKNSPVSTKIFQQKYKGCYSARNLGARNANCKILAFIDADERAERNWLKFLAGRFMDTDTAVVCGRVITDADLPLLTLLRIAPVNAVGLTSDGMKYATCNIAYRKDVFETLGGFNESFDPILRGDSDLGYRAEKAAFKIVYESQAKVYHPIKEMSLSSLLKLAKWRSHDVLLYAKHGKLVNNSLGDKLFQPRVGPLSLAVLTFVFLVGTIIVFFSISPYWMLILLALPPLWVSFFCFIGYRLAAGLVSKNPPLLLRIKSSLFIPLYSLTVLLARAYGSLKYKRLLL